MKPQERTVLRLSGDRGKIVIEDGKLTFWRLRESEREFNRELQRWISVGRNAGKCEIPVEGKKLVILGLCRTGLMLFLHGAALIAPGEEGIKGLTISNAFCCQRWTDNWVDLPIDEDLFEQHLQDKIKNSKTNKEAGSFKTTLDVRYDEYTRGEFENAKE